MRKPNLSYTGTLCLMPLYLRTFVVRLLRPATVEKTR